MLKSSIFTVLESGMERKCFSVFFLWCYELNRRTVQQREMLFSSIFLMDWRMIDKSPLTCIHFHGHSVVHHQGWGKILIQPWTLSSSCFSFWWMERTVVPVPPSSLRLDRLWEFGYLRWGISNLEYFFFWIFKLGVLVHSICEWLRRIFNFQEVSSLCNVALIPLPFVRCIFFPVNSELLGVYSFYVRTRLVVIIQGHFVFCVQFWRSK
jgi:hypothetical protein